MKVNPPNTKAKKANEPMESTRKLIIWIMKVAAGLPLARYFWFCPSAVKYVLTLKVELTLSPVDDPPLLPPVPPVPPPDVSA